MKENKKWSVGWGGSFVDAILMVQFFASFLSSFLEDRAAEGETTEQWATSGALRAETSVSVCPQPEPVYSRSKAHAGLATWPRRSTCVCYFSDAKQGDHQAPANVR